MPHKIIQFPQAVRDQDDIWLAIAMENERAADRVLDRISDIVMLLSNHPEAGRSRDDLRPGLRYIPMDSYLIFYSIGEGAVRIHRVVHGARKVLPEFFQD